MVNLYLIGTNHFDLRGPIRLEKFLNMVRPDTLGIEMRSQQYESSLYSHEMVLHNSFANTMKNIALYGCEKGLLLEQLAEISGYEVWKTTEYKIREQGVRLVCCDEMGDELRQKIEGEWSVAHNAFLSMIQDYDINFSSDNNNSCLLDVVGQFIQQNYDMIDNVPLSEQFSEEKFKMILTNRDAVAERRIRDLLLTTNHTFVYIGGAAHLFGNYRNLYERLSDLHPVRLKLNEVDMYR